MFLPLTLAFAAQGAFALDAENHWDGLGMTVFFLDDINQDGFREFGTSAFCTDRNALNGGTVYVMDGRSRQMLWRHDGIGHQARLGEFATAVGDVNGDGFRDYAAGARHESFSGFRTGSAYVFSGLDGALLHRFDGVDPNGEFGWTVAGLGDLDGDGCADLAVGAPDEGEGRGTVRFYSGRTGKLWHTAWGQKAGGRFGCAIALAGDVDEDGVMDYAIGASHVARQAGEVTVYSGATRHLMGRFTGLRRGAHLGQRLADAVDFNGDGDPELLVGEPCFDSVYLISLKSRRMMRQHHGPLKPTKSGLGHHFGACGDLDGDGFPDYFLGRAGEWEFGSFQLIGPGGCAQLVSGRTGEVLNQVFGEELDDAFGASVAVAADAAPGGRPVVLVGAPAAGDLYAGYAPGRVYGYFSWQGSEPGDGN